jgi:uncharacterized protein YxeA
MKKITFGLVLLAFLAGSAAYAEDTENPYVKTRAMKKKESEEAERQYKRTLQATSGGTTAPAKNDPWSNMRGTTDASKSK